VPSERKMLVGGMAVVHDIRKEGTEVGTSTQPITRACDNYSLPPGTLAGLMARSGNVLAKPTLNVGNDQGSMRDAEVSSATLDQCVLS